MIKIDRPKQAPKKLLNEGKKKRRAHCVSYTRNKSKYDSGERKFEFDSDIYGHKTVKESLIKAQHGKCCFCESNITHIAYGDVEHFRPKAGYKQNKNDSLGRPGYYWLAYEWTNLFFSCQICNQRNKGNLFPLKDQNRRAISHKDDIDVEEPMFVNPAEYDPEEYITFREEVAVAINDDPRGKVTIEALGLNREELCDMRRKYFDLLKTIYKVAHINPPIPESREASEHITKSIQDSSKYASMLRSAVRAGFEKRR